MRSATGVAAALVMLLAIPIALASQMIADGSAETVLHMAVGTGSILLAVAAFDFGLPRWAAWLGALSAAAFGSIFLLQGAAQITGNAALTSFAFDVLGQEIERFLPDLVLVWFVVLLAVGSRGWSRIVGFVTMTVVIVAEAAALGGGLVGADVPEFKVLFLLPFVWLLLESVKRRPDATTSTAALPLQVEGGAR
jgi:hypothetical protein